MWARAALAASLFVGRGCRLQRLVRFGKARAKTLGVFKSLAAFSLGAIVFFVHPIRHDEARATGLPPNHDFRAEFGPVPLSLGCLSKNVIVLNPAVYQDTRSSRLDLNKIGYWDQHRKRSSFALGTNRVAPRSTKIGVVEAIPSGRWKCLPADDGPRLGSLRVADVFPSHAHIRANSGLIFEGDPIQKDIGPVQFIQASFSDMKSLTRIRYAWPIV